VTTTSWQGGRASDSVFALLAPNGGPMTLEGTNTWVVRPPGAAEAIVLDPGPAGHPEHLAAVVEHAGAVALTLLSHHHRDHSEAVTSGEWAQVIADAPVRGGGQGAALRDGELLAVGGLELEVLHTPGHTADSISLLLAHEGVLLSGDTVLGRGSSVVPWPDGDLGAYFDSLDRLIDLAEEGRIRRIAPGHGPVITEPLVVLRQLRSHRLSRLEEVRGALGQGIRAPEALVAHIYGELPRLLTWAATATVRAQLAYLGEDVAAEDHDG